MKRYFAAALLIVTLPAFSQQAPEAALFRDLSRCDSTFFHTMAAQLYELSRLTSFQVEADIAYPKVANRRLPKESFVKFKAPIQVGQTVFVGYFDDLVAVSAKTSLFSWGFLARSTIADAADSLRPFIWDNDRLRRDAEVYVRSEVWSSLEPDKGWNKIATESGEPKAGTIERVFLIEPSEIGAQFIRVGCSVQGAVTVDILRQLRPDIAPEPFGLN